MEKCRDCKWWKQVDEPEWATWGKCDFDHHGIAVFIPVDRGTGELRTSANFGCVQFEGK